MSQRLRPGTLHRSDHRPTTRPSDWMPAWPIGTRQPPAHHRAARLSGQVSEATAPPGPHVFFVAASRRRSAMQESLDEGLNRATNPESTEALTG